ncbi:DUF4191 domain-containing protein [Lysobacter korlensis]|uniref:DUF4191 domain-containing protein n=1 Tax=Lysobacter korlensis TaxID=553636 RepID=A0ABV6RM95_9GAMM
MARTKAPGKDSPRSKEPGRLKQMWQVFQMTRRNDKSVVWLLLAAFLIPIALGILAAVLLTGGNPVGLVLYILTGFMAGLLFALIVLGRRAERAAYSQIAGQPGAVGAVLKNSLRRGWRASEMPVTVSPRTQDAVYRAVGRPGVVLIGEGPKSRTKRMLEDEQRNVRRIVPNVPVHLVTVGPDADSVPLHKVPSALKKYKRTLTKAEVLAVSNRLAAISKSSSLPIPKGIDPTKMRAPRPR